MEIDVFDEQIKDIIEKGKERGYVTCKELNKIPEQFSTPEHLEMILKIFNKEGIIFIDDKSSEDRGNAIRDLYILKENLQSKILIISKEMDRIRLFSSQPLLPHKKRPYILGQKRDAPKTGIVIDMISVMSKTEPMTRNEICEKLKEKGIEVTQKIKNNVKSYLSYLNCFQHIKNNNKKGYIYQTIKNC